MTVSDQDVAKHYSTEALLDRIHEAVRAAGGDPKALTPEDIKPVDEFHTGGLLATEALLEQLTIAPETRVLDIGSGLGGTARHIALSHGATVQGVDLTPAYVDVAAHLSKALGLSERTVFRQGSALDLPHDDKSFDLATMFHVGMNIADKTALFAEVARVLAPGGQFALFDVMAEADPCFIPFPVPWAEHDGLSHVAPPDAYRQAATGAGFKQIAERPRRDFTLEFFDRVFQMVAEKGMPPVGIHLLMRETAKEKLKNYVEAVTTHQIAPYEMIFRKSAA